MEPRTNELQNVMQDLSCESYKKLYLIDLDE